MITSRLFPRSMQADRPECREATIEITDAEIRCVLQIPPAEHAAANDAQVEQLLAQATPDELRDMVRELRRMLAGAQFAAKTNADTIKSMWRARG